MNSGVRKGDKSAISSPRKYAFRAFILVTAFVLLLPVVSIADSFGANTGDVPGHSARTATLDPSSITLVASPSKVFVNDTITFFANASSDDPGAILTFTIFYDCLDQSPTINPESPVTVNTTGSPWNVTQTFTYDHPGNLTQGGSPYFWVGLFVSDGTGNLSATTQVFVSPPPVITPPYFMARPDALSAAAGSTRNVVIKIADNQSDTVTVFWDFGDGTNATNVTVAPPTGIELVQSHIWDPRIPGKGGYNQTYFLNVTLSDGLHPPVNSSTLITISVPVNEHPIILDPGITASKIWASPMQQINFTAAASDPEGDPLTWTYNYSDGSVEVYHTGFTAPNLLVWQNATHSFATVGNYSVHLSVSDALVPNQIGSHNITMNTTVHIRINVPPTAFKLEISGSPVINATLGYVNVTLSVQAKDLDGDNFTLTWDLGVFGTRTNYSVGDAAQNKEFTTFLQVLTINETGTYHFAVTVTDGLPGHDVRLTAVANVSSTNQAPSILIFHHAPYSLGDFAAANESVAFILVVTDPERDPIELIWNFGDGSAKLYMNRTDYDAKGNITVLVNHTYVLKGDYNVTVIVTDNKVGGLFDHTSTGTLSIQVSVRPPVVIKRWTWWDSVSLSIFAAIPVLLVLWGYSGMLRRRKAEMMESLPETPGSSLKGGLGDPPKKEFEEGG